MFSVFVLILTLTQWVFSAPTSPIKELSEEQKNRIKAWKEDDLQNIWQLSGQFQGDIILTPNGRNGAVETKYRWPKSGSIVEVPYMFESTITEIEKSKIINALQVFVSTTCIRPVYIPTPSVTDHVYISVSGNGCYSAIGRRGGRQPLNLQSGTGCFAPGVIVHEFLHSLGFVHQHSAPERDDYVTIVEANVQSGQLNDFVKFDSSVITNFNVTYDYGSLMHYDAYAFSKNGEKTIITKDPNAVIGQRIEMSPRDILKVNRMYNCSCTCTV